MSGTQRRGTRLTDTSLRFTFDGREYCGQVGDTAASALLASGVRAMGRSVKYRRLRGVLAAGPEEPNALFTVGTSPAVIPNVYAPQLELRDGMVLRSQNRWPSLKYDAGSLLQVGSGFFGAGFYYKTFIWPSWHSWEATIRALAGLGEAPGTCELSPPAVEHFSCDVLVAGAGAAGLAAARAAARAGARVVLCEREPVCGGELEFECATIEGRPALAWVDATLAELASLGVRILTDTTLVGGTGGEYVAHHEPGGVPGANSVYKIRPAAFVIAMGAVERPIAFINNDLPGVMLLGAAERFLARYGVTVGSNLVLFANHDRVYAAAARLASAGMRVCAVVDIRDSGALGPEATAQRASLAQGGTECLLGYAVISATGGSRVRRAIVAPLASPSATRAIACDAVLVSGGWGPSAHAGLQEGGTTRYEEGLAAFVATDQPEGRENAGAANGLLELPRVLIDGAGAGARAARRAGADGDPGATPTAGGDQAPRLVPFWRSPADRAGEKRQFIDYQNDVNVADLRATLEEGFVDIEHVKRYTALGFGTDQGRIGGLLGAAILAELRGEPLKDVGTSRLRPPYHSVTMNSLAGLRVGARLRPMRRTPLHDWHLANGGVLEPMDLWMRTRYYQQNGPAVFEAGIAEAQRVRTSGGIVDGSTLGKIEVAGPDAAVFLDSLYLSKASTIKVGRSKYMVNLREDGMVLDDGIVLRLAEDRFIATTSSGHGGHMLSHFEHYRDTEWSGRGVTVTDVTESWGVIVVAGPQSRTVLHSVLGAAWQPVLDTLTHMAFARGAFGGQDLTVLRASFSGELAFELHCRPSIAVALWEALIAAGFKPYGLEALDILRVEKGYLVSSELNGETTPFDLCMDGLVKLGNPCVGRDLLDRPAFHESDRPRLVGVRALDGKAIFYGGSQLTTAEQPNRPCGYVTSSVYSPTLGEWVGLALVSREHPEGAVLDCRDPVRIGDCRVRLTSMVHYDPTGERMKS
ncbi:MAG: 2Fe-2S iron-sulfur cluster-binding protein [Pseudomonadota bacterium]